MRLADSGARRRTKHNPRRRTKHNPRRRWKARAAGFILAVVTLVSGAVVAGGEASEALPRGESVTFTGGLTISNFVLPNGKRAYCIEVMMGEPTGYAWLEGKVSALPGRSGVQESWGHPNGMRQMNYLIDRHGQNGDAWTAAAVQVTIWRMRENFQSGSARLNQIINTLESSQRGRDLIARSDRLYADAKAAAKAPVAAPTITGKLAITDDPSGQMGRYRVAYPKGTTSLSVTGGSFVRNGAATITVGANEASARYVDIARGATQVKVTGAWQTLGTAGWEPWLNVYGTSTAAAAVGQRVAVATGESSRPKRNGAFATVTATPPPSAQPPVASSLAQPAAEVGGVMRDELIVRAQPGSTLQMWPDAVASFTAYLQPVVGEQKYDADWQQMFGPEYEAQAEDPATGAPLWRDVWADPSGAPLTDATGHAIATVDDQGVPTTGADANGLNYPVPQLDGEGKPILDAEGNPLYSITQIPVLETRRDAETWQQAELDAMTPAERCLVQPVHHQAGIAVPRPGAYPSAPVTVRSNGTVHWVERVHAQGRLVHEGVCGLANETTRINQPGVITQAPEQIVIGEAAYDTATVSGTLLPNVAYTLRFEAYRAPDDFDLTGTVASCTAENIVFRSDRVPVTGVGEVRSPEFIAGSNHGSMLWWVETLELDNGSGPQILHRGECGLANETTRIGQPTVETKAQEQAIVGGHMTDTAILGGEFAANDGATWELEFRGYRAADEASDTSDDETTSVDVDVDVDVDASLPPVCDANNLLFEVPAVAVTGPGELTSAPVRVLPEWRGSVWWVETLWLTVNGERTVFAVGECGIANETTFVTGPEVVTEATPTAAIGDAITDTAIVSGELSDREGIEYQLRFEAFQGSGEFTGTDDAQCTAENLLWASDAVPVIEPGSVESAAFTTLPEHGDTIWWVESLWLTETDTDDLLLHRGTCGVEHETTRVEAPTVSTVATATVAVGEPLYDTAKVEGAISRRTDIEYRLIFTAYERPAEGQMTCEAGTEIAELSDLKGVVVTAPGQYTSNPVTARAAHVGLGGFVETLVLIENGQEYVVHRGECGVVSENFEIVPVETPPVQTPPVETPPAHPPVKPDLPRTGVNGASLWSIAGGVTVIGGVTLSLAIARKRRENA